MTAEDAERWIVNLIRNARLDAKIDSQQGHVVMATQTVSPVWLSATRVTCLSLAAWIAVCGAGAWAPSGLCQLRLVCLRLVSVVRVLWGLQAQAQAQAQVRPRPHLTTASAPSCGHRPPVASNWSASGGTEPAQAQAMQLPACRLRLRVLRLRVVTMRSGSLPVACCLGSGRGVSLLLEDGEIDASGEAASKTGDRAPTIFLFCAGSAGAPICAQ